MEGWNGDREDRLQEDDEDAYAPTAKDFVLVEVPKMQFVKIDGHGNPNTAPPTKRRSNGCTEELCA
jgi:hypothetical protein